MPETHVRSTMEPELPQQARTGGEREVIVRRQTPAAQIGDASVVARVVYLGSNPHKTVYLDGTIDIWIDETESVRWRPVRVGATVYNFNRVDAMGRPLKDKLTSPDRRPFDYVHNLDHLATFLEMTLDDNSPEFEIRATPDVREKIETFARLRRERVLRTTEEGPTLLREMNLV